MIDYVIVPTVWYVLGFFYFIFSADGMAYHNNKMFTTIDVDNDVLSGSNCASGYCGGWWYGQCADINLNGLKIYVPWCLRIYWYTWQQYSPMNATSMMVKRHP